MQLFVHEILDQVVKLKKVEEKVAFLHKHNSQVLRDFLKITYDPSVTWLVPDSAPPYTPCEPHNHPSDLRRRINDLTLCIAPRGSQVTPMKREQVFIGVLEAIHPLDAKIVAENALTHKPVKGLTAKVVAQAFPKLGIPVPSK